MPFVSNVSAAPTADPARIREQLAAQVCSPVLWERSIRWAIGEGIVTFLEPGPGQVLAGLMRKIDQDVLVRSAATPSESPS